MNRQEGDGRKKIGRNICTDRNSTLYKDIYPNMGFILVFFQIVHSLSEHFQEKADLFLFLCDFGHCTDRLY